MADELALKYSRINVNVTLGKAEMKGLIKKIVKNRWQELWTQEGKGRRLFEINKEVGNVRKFCGKRHDTIMSQLHIEHTALNQSLFKIGKHNTVLCNKCGIPETVKPVFFFVLFFSFLFFNCNAQFHCCINEKFMTVIKK